MSRRLPLIASPQGEPASPAETGAAPLRVALVVMPFASTLAPSIQAGLLQSRAREAGHACDAFYFNLDLAMELGVDTYEQIAHLPLPMLGEWLFSIAAFGDGAPDPHDDLLRHVDVTRLESRIGLSARDLRSLRREGAPAFVRRLADEVIRGGYDVVGFSSVFQQTVPCIALARELKQRSPEVTTIFGGANLQGEMGIELVSKVPWIDYAAIGEADDSFLAFLSAVGARRDPAGIPGIAAGRGVTAAPSPLTTEMDHLPTPTYHDFFARGASLGVSLAETRAAVELPIEGSRGCWWGAKHHCTFCGLAADTMPFRSKSAERFEAELTELAARHGTFRFLTTDAIADMLYFKTLFPSLARKGFGFNFFFEVKSNVGREQLRVMRQAGVERIQPGLESLSTNVLRLMDKGVTGIQNVNFLRWSRYYGFSVDWNLIWGFPGEAAADYGLMTEIMPQLHHLMPPTNMGPVQMHRFSPIFGDRARFPVRHKRAEASYRFAFPPEIDVDAVAYYFDYEFEVELPHAAYPPLCAVVEAWRARWEVAPEPTLTYRYAPGVAVIEDRRASDRMQSYTLNGPLADLYAACAQRPTSIARLQEAIGGGHSAGDIGAALADLVKRGLMIREGEQHLSLALPAGPAV